MAVSTIALYASPPSSVCSTPHQINAHASYDFELGSRSSSPAGSTAPPSTSQKPVMGGLSCLFSSPAPAVKHAPPLSSNFSGEEDEMKELSSSFSYSPSKFAGSSWKRDQSPVSVFHGPVSCSSSGRSSTGSSSRIRSFRGGTSGLFDGFVRNALGSSCLDYDLDAGDSSAMIDELTFNLEDNFVEGGFHFEPYAKKLLLGAQMRHKIFCEEFVIKAFCEAEKAHRGQVDRIMKLTLFRVCFFGFARSKV